MTRNVPDRSLVAGNPARVFLTYTEEHFEKDAARVRAANAARRTEEAAAATDNA